MEGTGRRRECGDDGARGVRRWRGPVSLIVAAVPLVLCGCLTTVRTPLAGTPRPGTGVVVPAGRQAMAGVEEISVEPLPGRVVDGYESLSVRMPSSGFNRQPDNELSARYYRALHGARRSLVMVVPAWGNPQFPAATLRRHVLRSGLSGDVDVLQVLGETSLVDWRAMGSSAGPAELERHTLRSVRSFQTMVTDLRGLLAWAIRTQEVDPRRVAVVGYSLGATAALRLMALEPSVAAGVTILPAAGLHEVVASCGNRVREAREQMERRQGWTRDELSAWFEAPLAPIDPLGFAAAVSPERVLLVEAARDQCVPRWAREALWRGLGRPELLTIDGGHRTSFLTLTPVGLHATTRKVIGFLETRLGRHAEDHGGAVLAGSQ